MMSGKLREHCENENEEMTAENSVCGNRKLLVSVRSLQSVIIVIQKKKKKLEITSTEFGYRQLPNIISSYSYQEFHMMRFWK